MGFSNRLTVSDIESRLFWARSFLVSADNAERESLSREGGSPVYDTGVIIMKVCLVPSQFRITRILSLEV